MSPGPIEGTPHLGGGGGGKLLRPPALCSRRAGGVGDPCHFFGGGRIWPSAPGQGGDELRWFWLDGGEGVHHGQGCLANASEGSSIPPPPPGTPEKVIYGGWGGPWGTPPRAEVLLPFIPWKRKEGAWKNIQVPGLGWGDAGCQLGAVRAGGALGSRGGRGWGVQAGV